VSYITHGKGICDLLVELGLHAIKSSFSILPRLRQFSLVRGLHFCKLVISLLLKGTYGTYLDLQVILPFLLAFLNLRLNRFDFFGMSVYQHLLQRDLDI